MAESGTACSELARTGQVIKGLLGIPAFLQRSEERLEDFIVGASNPRIAAKGLDQGRLIIEAKITVEPSLDRCHRGKLAKRFKALWILHVLRVCSWQAAAARCPNGHRILRRCALRRKIG